MEEQQIRKKFDRQAMLYKKEHDIGILSKWRKKIIPYAHGNALELAVGAGGNFQFYEKDVHVTAIDISPNMLEKAIVAAELAQLDVTFMLGNAETVHFSANQFDTIVSTLSFCGYDDPLNLLKKVYRWLKPGGTLLLFEHGMSDSPMIRLLQNKFDPLAKRIIGCHQNRPIIKMVQKLSVQIEAHQIFGKGIFHVVRATSLKSV